MIEVRFLLFTAETEEHLTRASPGEIRQLLANRHVTTKNPRGPNPLNGMPRSLLIGRTDAGRRLTVVIEAGEADGRLKLDRFAHGGAFIEAMTDQMALVDILFKQGRAAAKLASV